VLGIDELRAVKRARWPATRAGAAMAPLALLLTVPPEQALSRTLAQFTESRYSYALILSVGGRREEDGPAVGIITPRRVLRHLAEGVRARPAGDPVTAVGPQGPLDPGKQRRGR